MMLHFLCLWCFGNHSWQRWYSYHNHDTHGDTNSVGDCCIICVRRSACIFFRAILISSINSHVNVYVVEVVLEATQELIVALVDNTFCSWSIGDVFIDAENGDDSVAVGAGSCICWISVMQISELWWVWLVLCFFPSTSSWLTRLLAEFANSSPRVIMRDVV